jgi:hypothetical protein
MPELRVEAGPQKGQIFFLRPPGPIFLGRDMKADFPLFDRSTSRTHFRIDFADEGYRLTDLESRTGTYVNDQRVASALLEPGSHILVGKTAFTFEYDSPQDGQVGKEIEGYKILERLGSGETGTTYRAFQQKQRMVVALKVLSGDLATDKDFAARFVRETREAAELRHPAIVRIHEVRAAGGVLFYSLEFMAQGSVEDLCRRHGRLSVERALQIALEAARGLEFAHQQGVVHGGIKPGSIMIHESGSVKIGELLRTARTGEPQLSWRARGISASPLYLSPEQALGKHVDPRSDIYSLGASLHHMLSGAPPFQGENPKEILAAHIQEPPPDLREIRDDVPDELAHLVKSLMAKDPAARPPAASLVALHLEAMLSTTSASPPTSAALARRRWLRCIGFYLLATLTFLLGAGLGFFFLKTGRMAGERSARLQSVRGIISAGMGFLRSGNLEAAVLKQKELTAVRGAPEDWERLGPEIKAFEDALQAALRRAKE